jgi:hypothetical protein
VLGKLVQLSGVGSGIFGAGGLFFLGSPDHYVRVVEKLG